MKMKKRLIALLLMSVMILSAACGKKNEGSEGSGATNTPAPTKEGSTDAPAATEEPPAPTQVPGLSYSGYNPLDYGMEPFSSAVTIKIPVFDRARDDVPDVTSNYYTKWVNENFGKNLNVNVEFVNITRADTMASYNKLLASGEWPTVFMEYDFPKVSQWASDGALTAIDVNEFRNVAPVWYEKAGGAVQFDMFTLAGDTYFAPALRPDWNVPYTHVTFYRKDWYRKAGIELATTYEEYIAAMQTFMELGYTNGNAILPKGPYTKNFQVYSESEWPRNEEEWVMYSDVNVAPLTSRGGYYVLKKHNNEYNLGLATREFELDITMGSSSQAESDFINGIAYTYATYLSADIPVLTAFFENNPDAELGIIGNNTVYDAGFDQWGGHVAPQARATNPAGMFVAFSSRATADELKAAWMYMEWMAQPDVLFFMQNGVEGETFNYNENGIPEIIPGVQGEYWMGFSSNKDYWCIVVEGKQLGSIEDDIAAVSPKGLPQDFTQELIDNYYILKTRVEEGLVYCDPFFAVELPAVNEYMGELEALFVEYATKLVKCSPDEFDALYEQYCQQYLNAGYQKIIDERLKAYKDGNTTVLSDVASGRAAFVPADVSDLQPGGRKYNIFQ